ncbi:MAG: BadF/BadG/BcrA/BcrD ATPase family protein [Anaerolineae bacterium]
MTTHPAYYMGIDGGGTHLRAAICTFDDPSAEPYPIAQREYGPVNPNNIGRDAARELLHRAIAETLTEAALVPSVLTGVGVGIAGLAAEHSGGWLHSVMREALPNTAVALSSDVEIALVGAHGARRGLLILAGTGSAVYGINDRGDGLLVGGWGYLLGDEGSGYWIGNQALRTFAHAADQQIVTPAEPNSILPARLAEALNLSKPKDLIGWLYNTPSQKTRVPDVASLAPLVLEAADQGDARALEIIEQAAADLESLVRTAARRLDGLDLPVAFAGGLLSADNALTRRLCQRLGLSALPIARYAPVIGAALLAYLQATPRP